MFQITEDENTTASRQVHRFADPILVLINRDNHYHGFTMRNPIDGTLRILLSQFTIWEHYADGKKNPLLIIETTYFQVFTVKKKTTLGC